MANCSLRYFPAPAKINRMLRVIRREADGYHYLQTVFQFTSLFDEIGFKASRSPFPGEHSNRLLFHYPHTDFALEDDLIYRAIIALQEATGQTFNVEIDLKKRLPMGAGLGGGSSNAATTLVALNALLNLKLSTERLIEIGAKLGADVPIFIYGKSAWAEGIGEKLTPLTLPEETFLLIRPNISISTKVIFESEYLPRNSSLFEDKVFTPERALNDCEPAIFHHYPEMREYIRALSALNLSPYITGTGSCIYTRLPNNDERKELDKLAEKYHWELIEFKTLNQSPLQKTVKAL